MTSVVAIRRHLGLSQEGINGGHLLTKLFWNGFFFFPLQACAREGKQAHGKTDFKLALGSYLQRHKAGFVPPRKSTTAAGAPFQAACDAKKQSCHHRQQSRSRADFHRQSVAGI